MRRLLIGAVGLFMLVMPASAMSEVPPFRAISPADGSTVGLAANQNLVFEFTCPSFSTSKNGSGYQVGVASSPELNPEGKFASAFRLGTAYPHTINAEENLCQAEFSWVFIHSSGPLYWRVERPYCEWSPSITGESCEALGPVLTVNVVIPPPKVASPPPSVPITKPPVQPSVPPVSTRPEFSAWTGCGVRKGTLKSTHCRQGQAVGAFFVSTQAVNYTICVRYPTSQRQCKRNQRAAGNTLYVNKITANYQGRYEVTWEAAGRRETKVVHVGPRGF